MVINLIDKPINKFKYNVDNINDNVLKPFYLMIKNDLRNDSTSFNERLKMFLYCEHLLPINDKFMWLDHDYVLSYDVYDTLHFKSLVLFKELIPLLDKFTNRYPANYTFDKIELIEKMIRSGYRGFVLE